MLEQLPSGHVLEIFMITNVTTKLRAVTNGMLLKIFHGLPEQDSITAVLVASMRELTEVNAILKDIVNILYKIWGAAIWAVQDKSRSSSFHF
jgi:hypothetical protein